MSAFHILEDVETSCVPDISKRKKSILEKQNGKTRSVLQPLSNGVKQDVKRAKFTINNQKTQEIKEKSKENLEKIKVIDEIGKIEKSNAIITSDEAEDDDHIPKSILYSIEYKQDIWNHLKYLEKFHPFPNSKYMLRQNDLCWRSRSILVDWLASVSHEYKLSNETFHLSVHYVDRFLMHMAVAKTKFQLVGAAAMLLAGKIEEVYPIDVKEWAYLTRDSFTPKQILKMEQLLTKILKFKMQPPTISTFIDHFCYEHQLDAKTSILANWFY
ncbi:hypothetical protein ABEB36_009700 [Hypothenemus hampei]|uniref:Cyclin-like domain-containing protein n=1 Tax=Hypothenemus hampei TaxID=57062 RepID=A0ABD1EH55_HYPHA